MIVAPNVMTYQDRIDALRRTKLRHNAEKQAAEGSVDLDDFPLILPPEDQREIVRMVGGSGVALPLIAIKDVPIRSTGPDGVFHGARAAGENYRALLEAHPVYIDPLSSLAGAIMAHFLAYVQSDKSPDFFDFSHLHGEQAKYQITHGIGGMQHFCHDLAIGLELGWGGLLSKIRHYQKLNTPRGAELYAGLEATVLGVQNWIHRHAIAAHQMAAAEENAQLRQNLEEMAGINQRLVTDAPQTFREAVQWILWYQLMAKMYNFNGAMGRPDVLLLPYYEREVAAGTLTDEEAMFHLACFLERETPYIHIGGPDETGRDVTNRLSYLVLEAAHRLKIPANVAVCVGQDVDPGLLRRSVEILLEDKTGIPKFLGIDNCIEGFTRNGYPDELARQRVYSGCHWFGLPGREYTMADLVKIGLGHVLQVALRDMLCDDESPPSLSGLWAKFEQHLRRAIEVTAEGIDFHLEHFHKVFPELALDLLCHGPIERGLDVTHGGVDYYNIGIDGTGLANVADSFAAVEQRVEQEDRLGWDELLHHLDNDWAGQDGEKARLMMKAVPHFGSGGCRADEWAVRVSQLFTNLVKEKPTPAGFNMIPGLFSWALMMQYGKELGATPDGRRAGDSISQGANPYAGFRRDGAPTALAIAVASVQPGYGNTAPLQLDIDPGMCGDGDCVDNVVTLIRAHFDLGGTMININVIDVDKLLAAHKDPSLYPDLIVRVTGFSAYFSRLSPELRQFVIDRTIASS